MLGWLTRRFDRAETARKLYGSSVTQARRQAFYANWHIPDTPQGRFEMVVLHVVLLVRRLTREGPAGARLARALNEAFIADMDDNMREMTFGDLRVPREIKQVTTALLDRHKAYADALQDPAGRQLQEAVAGQLRYLGNWSNLLLWPWLTTCGGQRPRSNLVPAKRLLDGNIEWPDPRLASLSINSPRVRGLVRSEFLDLNHTSKLMM